MRLWRFVGVLTGLLISKYLLLSLVFSHLNLHFFNNWPKRTFLILLLIFCLQQCPYLRLKSCTFSTLSDTTESLDIRKKKPFNICPVSSFIFRVQFGLGALPNQKTKARSFDSIYYARYICIIILNIQMIYVPSSLGRTKAFMNSL